MPIDTPPLSASGEGSHGSILSGNYAPTRLSSGWKSTATDLIRLIGQPAYDARVLDVVREFACPRFAAILAVHGRAVQAGEISR